MLISLNVYPTSYILGRIERVDVTIKMINDNKGHGDDASGKNDYKSMKII